MTPEVLGQITMQLTVVQWLLGLVLFFLIAGPAAVALFFWRMGRQMRNQLSCGTESFQHRANELRDKGDYDKLIELSRERRTKYPKDAYAWWYEGIGLYQKHDYEPARECLRKSAEISPAFASHYTAPCLEHIEKMKGRDEVERGARPYSSDFSTYHDDTQR